MGAETSSPARHMLIKRKSIEQEESSRPARKPKYAPVTLSEQDGVRYLHFGTEWVNIAIAVIGWIALLESFVGWCALHAMFGIDNKHQ